MTSRSPGSFAASLLDLALPAVCPGCGAEGIAFCGACIRTLAARRGLPAGVLMGLPAPQPLPLVQLEWCAPFSGAVRAALHQLKYGGEKRLAAPLAAAMAARWSEAGVGGDMLVPVPVHAQRARQRGYDQAVLLATAAARELGMPMMVVLERTRTTSPQFELGRVARRTNVAGAFALRSPRDARAIVGKWVVLVDDVATTGSTLVACAEALYGAGAAAVSGLTVARER
jgi:ComF family protein